MPSSLQRQVGQLRRLAAAVDGQPLPVGGALTDDRVQVAPHVLVEVQRVLHELVREPRLLGHAARRNQIGDAVRLHVHALDAALAHEPLDVDVRQPERDAELVRQRPLGDARVLLDRFEQLQVAMRFDIHH